MGIDVYWRDEDGNDLGFVSDPEMHLSVHYLVGVARHGVPAFH
jgi:hypothetical protein